MSPTHLIEDGVRRCFAGLLRAEAEGDQGGDHGQDDVDLQARALRSFSTTEAIRRRARIRQSLHKSAPREA